MSPKTNRKLPEATIGRICRAAIGHLGSIETHAPFIAKANEFVDDYTKGVDYSRVNRGGAEGSSVEMAALNTRVDDIGVSLTDFARALENVGIWSGKLEAARVKVQTLWTEDAQSAAEFVARQSAESAGGGRCANCTRPVSGSRVDRLRGGRCEACAKYRQRNPSKERPRHLWGGDSLDDTCQSVRTHLGVDHGCVLEWGHADECQFPSIELAS